MGSLLQLVGFIMAGVAVLSWGFDYSLLVIVISIGLFITVSVLYFRWEEMQKNRKSVTIKNKAVPSQALFKPQQAPARNPMFLSVPPMKPENRSRIVPGMKPVALQFEYERLNGNCAALM
jgi:hypothetical protein